MHYICIFLNLYIYILVILIVDKFKYYFRIAWYFLNTENSYLGCFEKFLSKKHAQGF